MIALLTTPPAFWAVRGGEDQLSNQGLLQRIKLPNIILKFNTRILSILTFLSHGVIFGFIWNKALTKYYCSSLDFFSAVCYQKKIIPYEFCQTGMNILEIILTNFLIKNILKVNVVIPVKLRKQWKILLYYIYWN